MRRLRRFILRNWLPLTVGFLTTAWAVNCQYQSRGYMAIGSEWLITPFLVFVTRATKNGVRYELPMWIELFGGERSAKKRRNRKYRRTV